MPGHWCQTGSAQTTLQQTSAWGYAPGWRLRLSTHYGTVRRDYQEVASSMDWPIPCHQEAVRQYLSDPATLGTSQMTSGSFQHSKRTIPTIATCHTNHCHLFPLFPKANISIIDDTLAITASPLTDSVIWFLSESTKSPGRTLQKGGAM